MKKNLNNLITILLFVILFLGICLLLYPTASDYWNSLHQSRAITDYSQKVAVMDTKQYTKIWDEAKKYNSTLLDRSNSFLLDDMQKLKYEELLNVGGTGVMGYIEIPSIQCSLPIYHGTDDAVLQIAVGHLEWTSLPVGGVNTHTVLSGHRGLPSAKLFTNLDRLVVGDVFMLRVLDEVMSYEVDQILIVEPQETDALQIVEGEDLCTLVTCTPYGINTHRLLVRGHRVENQVNARVIHVTADAMQIEPLIVAPIVAMPMLLVLLIILLIPKKKMKSGGDDDEEL